MKNNHINYVEFGSSDLKSTKQFYEKAFGWRFTDYGPEYVAFAEAGLDGGFFRTDAKPGNGALVILYHNDLTYIKGKVIESGGQITKDVFRFPGGSRFHFLDPSGNELAVWSDK